MDKKQVIGIITTIRIQLNKFCLNQWLEVRLG